MQKDLVASSQRDRAVKRRVALGAQAARRDLGLHLRESLVHRDEVLFSAATRGKLRQLDLQRFTCFEHLRQSAAPFKQLRERIAKTACPAEKRAFTVADVDEAQRLQHHKCLAYRRSAHTQPLCQITLGWELVARRHAGLPHEVGEALANVLVQAAALERTKRGGGWCAHRGRV